MNKHYLLSKMKSTGTAYLCWFFFGCHYIYLDKWLYQFLYWFSFGGFGIWALVDLFTMSSKIDAYNIVLARQIEDIERKEKEEAHSRNLAMMKAMSNKTN